MLTLHGPEIANRILNVLPMDRQIPMYTPPLHDVAAGDENMEKAVIAIVEKFGWDHLVLMTDNSKVIKSFNEKAANKSICVMKNVLLQSTNR